MKLPFFKKKEPEKMRGKGYVPIDRVRELTSRGFSESEAIDVLRREGFSPDEIDKALTQALRVGIGAARPAPPTTPPVAEAPKFPPTPTFPPKAWEKPAPALTTLPTLEELKPKPAKPERPEMPVLPETALPEQYYQPYTTEEYIDYAVQERMQELSQKLGEFAAKYSELEKKIAGIHEQLDRITQTRGGEQQQIITKIDNFKDTVTDVNMRVSSLEKAFKETLPALIESVRALSDLVQRLKREA